MPIRNENSPCAEAPEEHVSLSSTVLTSDNSVLETILNNSVNAFFFLDDQLHCAFMNPAAERMTGYSAAECIGRRFSDIVRGSCPQLSFGAGHPLEGQAIFMRRNGSPYEVHYRVSPLPAPGLPGSTLIEVQDISAHHRVARALRESTERLAVLLEAGGVGTFDWNVRDNTRVWSDELGIIYGISPYELTPSSYEEWLAYIVPEDRERVMQAVEKALADGIFEIDFRIRRGNDGEIRWIHSRGKILRDKSGAPVHLVGVDTDITDRKRTEEVLSATLARERAFLEHLPVGIWFVSGRGEIEYGNPTARQIWAGARYIDADRFGEYKAWWHGTSRQITAEEWAAARAIRRGETSLNEVIDIECFDGSSKTILNSAVPVRDDDGTVLGAVVFNQDITDDKAAERVLREADRRKDEFLAVLAHELRNPLAPIRSGLQLLDRVQDPDTAGRVREMMHRQLTQMVRLIDDLLDISRITTGKVILRKQTVSLRAIVDLALEASRPFIEEHEHELSVILPDEALSVFGDITRLAQVVSNMLTNAAKYTPAGGRIILRVDHSGPEGIISVADTGLGIPRERLSDVFEMFTQVNQNLVGAHGGLGIGLALVKRLIAKHNGSVEAESAGPGQGSTFTVRLPLVAPESMSAETIDAGTVAVDTAPLKILVVDDNRDGADSLALLLDLQGHSTAKAYDGPAAIHLAAELIPDLIFLDLGLPGMTGYEVITELRTNAALAETTFVALTGWGADEDKRRTHEAGFHHHLTKPVAAEELERVMAALGRRRSTVA